MDPLDKVIVLLCIYKPGPPLVHLLHGLLKENFPRIVIVHDGPSEDWQAFSPHLPKASSLKLIDHQRNLGKGQALKTGFEFIRKHYSCAHILSADADGQHKAEDIRKVAETAIQHPDHIIFGRRVFSFSQIPLRNFLGNRITSLLCQLFFNIRMSDTQTGLRSFPAALLSSLVSIPGDRYEYEFNQFLWIFHHQLPFREVIIKGLYERNQISHFRPLMDSWRIYKLLFNAFLSRIMTGINEDAKSR